MAVIIDGKKVASALRQSVSTEVGSLSQRGIVPGLAAVIVGDNPASHTYVAAKSRACAEVGIFSDVIRLPHDSNFNELIELVRVLNSRSDIDGILIQSPLPSHLSEGDIYRTISPLKDVDCFHPENVGLLSLGTPRFRPCTPAGVLELLRAYEIPTAGKDVVVLGRSNIVGRPLATMLSQKGSDATVTLCHSRTHNIAEVCSRADILVAAVGRPETVRKEFVKVGAVVIDVGVNRVADESAKTGYRIVGDVHYAEVEPAASFITPVPGGVGPMTIAMLLQNTLISARARHVSV